VKIQVNLFLVVTPCSAVVGYQRFGGPCCLHLQGVTTPKTSTRVTTFLADTAPAQPFHGDGNIPTYTLLCYESNRRQMATVIRQDATCDGYTNRVSCFQSCSCAFFFNWAQRHECVLGKWKYSSTHSLTSALDGSEWSVSRTGRFIPRERAPGTHWIGGSVGPRAVLDAVAFKT
jgi:hypothetical protein